MQIIAISIIKGGTGKTATAAALAQAATRNGQRALAIDLDPQANLTNALGADQTARGAYNLLSGTPAADVLQITDQGITVISASPDLSTIRTTPGSAARLRDALEPIKNDFDFCVIDTPPTLGELIYNALSAADGLLIPLETDASGLQGLYQITDIANHIKKTNKRLQIYGALLTRYDGRPKINKYMKDVIAEKGEEIGAPLLMEIRNGVAVREAAATMQSLFDYAPRSNPAKDYRKLYEIVAERTTGAKDL